ncbi:MAG TPA: hypothetical protein VK762_03855 [Polyangiaceae bacterium]|nr:hypothetical protein [Polyangiaceae bacterium]
MDTIEGVETTDGYGALRQVLRSGAREIEDEVRSEIERLYEVSRESLRAVWPSTRAVAEALLEREELDGASLDQVLGNADIFAPVFAIQARAEARAPCLPFRSQALGRHPFLPRRPWPAERS